MASPAKSRRGGKSYRWTLEARVALLEICADYQHTHANSHSFKWPQIVPHFNQRVGDALTAKQLSNKMVEEKKEYNCWKDLRHKETGLGFNDETGQILASAQWWEHKVKENSIFKKFRSEGVPPVIEDLWARLFEGTVATGEDIRMPGMQSSSARTGRGSQSQPVGHAETESPVETCLGDDDDEDPLLHRRTSPVLEHIGRNYGSPPPVVTPPGSGRGRDEFSPSGGGGPSLPPRGSAHSEKRKSSGSKPDPTTSLGHIGEMAKRYCTTWDKEEAQKNASVTSPDKRPKGQCSVSDAMKKLYDMCELGLLEPRSDFFFNAADLFLEDPRRELFMSFEDDETRLLWLLRVLSKP